MMISRADIWVVYDTVQMTRQDWRSRNRILVRGKVEWLTIPVVQRDRESTQICEALIYSDGRANWVDKHMKRLEVSLAPLPYFENLWSEITTFYQHAYNATHLTEVTVPLTEKLLELLSINTTVVVASTNATLADSLREVDRSRRLAAMCATLGASKYITTPKALGYMDQLAFAELGIQVEILNMSKLLTSSIEQTGVPLNILDTIARQGLPTLRNALASSKKIRPFTSNFTDMRSQ